MTDAKRKWDHCDECRCTHNGGHHFCSPVVRDGWYNGVIVAIAALVIVSIIVVCAVAITAKVMG